MEGDRVRIEVTAEEKNGAMEYSTELSEKPQFMLNEEYNEHVIWCALEAVRKACMVVYPENEGARRKIAEMIAMKV